MRIASRALASIAATLVAGLAVAQSSAVEVERRLEELEPHYQRYLALRLDDPRARQLLTRLKVMVKQAADLEKRYTTLREQVSGEAAVLALEHAGAVYTHLAGELISAPVPERLTDDQAALYRRNLAEKGLALADRALKLHRQAVEVALAESPGSPSGRRSIEQLQRLQHWCTEWERAGCVTEIEAVFSQLGSAAAHAPAPVPAVGAPAAAASPPAGAPPPGPISREHALEIARRDAATVYPDLARYRVDVWSDESFWRIDYEPSDGQPGGGPHYIIDIRTGEIVFKRYDP